MTTQQPEALRLAVSSSAMADEGEMIHLLSWHEIRNLLRADATELRRQHARIAELEAIAASAGSEPVAHLWQHCETGRTRIVMPDMIVDADASWQVVGPLYLGAAPPTAQAEGWRLVPVEPTQEMIDAMRSSVWLPACYRAVLAAAPCPPTSAEGVEHG